MTTEVPYKIWQILWHMGGNSQHHRQYKWTLLCLVQNHFDSTTAVGSLLLGAVQDERCLRKFGSVIY